jgi:hypothetical protein
MPEIVSLEPLSGDTAAELIAPNTGLVSLYSGVVINQNGVPASTNDAYDLDPTAYVLQEFYLPDGYRRGTESGEAVFPRISGLQVMVECLNDHASAQIDWFIEYQIFGAGWTRVGEGTSTGVAIQGPKVWFNIYFDENSVEVDEAVVATRWRFGIRSPNVSRWWYVAPNPLNVPHVVKAYAANGTTPLVSTGGDDFSFCFRVLGLTADEGTDFLGNAYRSAVIQAVPESISTALGADPDSYWLSKPNPSKFAVENLYFDVSQNDAARVIDRVLVDPITPGTYFSMYYTSEGEAGLNDGEWESKLWTRIPQNFRMERRETHVLGEPVSAKYLKIEFSHLQARHYAPGDFQQPIRYKKHPKWVLDYFLARLSTDLNPFLVERTAVIYDAIDLAYNYYLDDLGQEPETTVDVNNTALTQVTDFLSDRTDASDRVDPQTLDKIGLALDAYRYHPAYRGVSNTLMADYARQTVDNGADYSVEQPSPPSTATSQVSTLNRDMVAMEQNYPVMFFYLTCRHAYREVSAKFTHDRAYFVGVREIAFLRDNYMTAFDTATYIEPNADTLNIERNEFLN